MLGVWAVAIVGCVGTTAGIYYSFTLPWSTDISKSSWMTWVGGISLGVVIAAMLVYFFGRRSASKLSNEDTLAHLAVLDLNRDSTSASSATATSTPANA